MQPHYRHHLPCEPPIKNPIFAPVFNFTFLLDIGLEQWIEIQLQDSF